MKRQSFLILLFLFAVLTSCIRDKSTQPHFIFPKTYEFEYIGLSEAQPREMLLDDRFLYVCTSMKGLLRKNMQNSSNDWEQVSLLDTTSRMPITYVYNILIDEIHSDWMLISGHTESVTGYALYRSLDGGRHCQLIEDGLVNQEGYTDKYKPLYIFRQFSEFILGFSSSGIYRTTDFGKSWVTYSDMRLTQVVRHPKDQNIIWGGRSTNFEAPQLFLSTDFGKTWKYIDVFLGHMGVPIISIQPFDSRICYVGAGSNLLRTKDLGKSWDTIRNIECYPIFVDPLYPKHIWIKQVLDDYIHFSLMESWDQGDSWNAVSSSLSTDVSIYQILWHAGGNVLYALTNQGIYRCKF
jgi:hypothetical protein